MSVKNFSPVIDLPQPFDASGRVSVQFFGFTEPSESEYLENHPIAVGLHTGPTHTQIYLSLQSAITLRSALTAAISAFSTDRLASPDAELIACLQQIAAGERYTGSVAALLDPAFNLAVRASRNEIPRGIAHITTALFQHVSTAFCEKSSIDDALTQADRDAFAALLNFLQGDTGQEAA